MIKSYSAEFLRSILIRVKVCFIVTISLAVSACANLNFTPPKQVVDTPVGKYDPTDEGITKLFNDIQIHLANRNWDAAIKLIQNLIPTEKSHVEVIFNLDKPGSDKAVDCVLNNAKKINNQHKLLVIFNTKPDRNQTNVHGAMTEEIALNKVGSVVHEEFPAGVIPLAAAGVLKANTRFYEIERVKPGKNIGTKWHMFAHTPDGWKMFGPFWRAYMTDRDKRVRFCGK